MATLYLDTSALVKLYVEEEGREAVAKAVRERHALRGFDAIHLASAARLRESFSDLHFLAFDDRLVEAARRAAVPVHEEARG